MAKTDKRQDSRRIVPWFLLLALLGAALLRCAMIAFVEVSSFGIGTATMYLAKAARAYAFIKRRGYVVPEDVRAVAHDVLRHRIGLTYEAEASNVTSEEIVSKIINKVEVP